MPVSQKNPRCLAPLRGRLRRGPPGAVPAGGWENTGLGHFKDTRLGWDILKTRASGRGGLRGTLSPSKHATTFPRDKRGWGNKGLGHFEDSCVSVCVVARARKDVCVDACILLLI